MKKLFVSVVLLAMVFCWGSAEASDKVYLEIKTCLDLQYSYREGFLPSHTLAGAICLYNADKKHGRKVATKNIYIWLSVQPRGVQYMTLIPPEQQNLIMQARSVGLTWKKIDMAEYLIAGATIVYADSTK